MKKTLIISLLFLFGSAMIAKPTMTEPQFSVDVSSTEVLLGNYIEVTFTLKNAGGEQFEAPDFEGFDIVGGPNQSSSFSMVNGDVSQSISYTYYLKPQDVGNLYVAPAFIEVEGKTMETQPIEIVVVPNPDGIIEKPNNNNSRSRDFFNFPSDDFFSFPKRENTPPRQGENEEKISPKKKKKKRKVYRI